MKAIVLVFVLVATCKLWVLMNTATAAAVDLTGKAGVVDPKDLKKDDPKPPKVEGNAPPPLPASSSDPTPSPKP